MSRQVVRQSACRALGPRALLLAPLALAMSGAQAAPLPGGTLVPTTIPKYVTPLVIPPVMNKAPGATTSDYDIAVRQFKQQILPGGHWNAVSAACGADPTLCTLPATTVWSYGPADDPLPDSSAIPGGAVGLAPAPNSQFNYPAYTIETTSFVKTTVDWINQLVVDPVACKASTNPGTDVACNYIPHLLPVDRSLHWANPEQLPCIKPNKTKDCAPDPTISGALLQQPYLGPVPMVVHVHGAHATPESDGYAEAWWLPNANNIPLGYATTGTFVNQFGVVTNDPARPGVGTFTYPNSQPSSTVWYHDHALGMTRNNVYAGPAGFWILRELNGGETGLVTGTLPGNAPAAGQAVLDLNIPGNPVRAAVREIPIAIQDRSFNDDGSLFYPDNRAFFEGVAVANLQIPFIGDPTTPSDIAAIWNPEAFFNTMVVNGVTWPSLEVEPDLYRFRLLNGCNSRFLNLALFVVTDAGVDKIFGTADDTLGAELPFYQIGAEQSLLPNVVQIQTGQRTTYCKNNAYPCNQLTQLPGTVTTPLPPDPNALPPALALLMGNAERADVIVDFSGLASGTRVRMVNTGPDEPFGGFPVGLPPDPDTTFQVMEFMVGTDDTTVGEGFTPPASLVLSPVEGVDLYPAGKPNTNPVSRDLALLEEESIKICVTVDAVTGAIVYDDTAVPNPADPATCVVTGSTTLADSVPFGPKAAVLGITGSSAAPTITLWDDPIETNPQIDTAGNSPTETWEFWNHTVDAHPIHVHEVKFKVVNRQAFDPTTGALDIVNGPRSPEATEAGWKDTVIAYPSDVTRIVATFDLPGLYVWHCHIVEHEDNEMMVPYCIGNKDRNLGPVAPGCILNEAPVVFGDAYNTNEDTALTVPARGVLGNDTDINANNILTAVLVSPPANGTVTLNADGSFTYTPSVNFNGSDSFTYKANDAVLDSPTAATVTITVTPLNDAPVAVADAYSTAEDTLLTIAAAGVLGNDTDVEGSPLTAVLTVRPGHGSLTLNPDGSFTYTPYLNYNGPDVFTYVANDGTASSSPATVSLTVTPVNDAPVSANDAYGATAGTAVTVVAPGVLANDTDADGNALTAVLASQPTKGTVTLAPNGGFTYTPTAGVTGTDSFTYQASDGPAFGDPATVTITVSAAPTAQLYLSLRNDTGTLNGLAYADEDILSWNGTAYAMVFDGSVAGLPAAADISAFDIDITNNRILMAFYTNLTVPGVGAITSSDIVAYNRGTGTFSLVFDGSDVGLGGGTETLDALQLLPDGRLIVSTTGLALVPSGGVFQLLGDSQDLLAFKPTTLGAVTAGTWAVYFDGSDVGLTTSYENVDATAVGGNGAIYLSTSGDFAVSGLIGQNEDVFVCNAPATTGPNTKCSGFSLFFDGTARGLTADDVDGIDLP